MWLNGFTMICPHLPISSRKNHFIFSLLVLHWLRFWWRSSHHGSSKSNRLSKAGRGRWSAWKSTLLNQNSFIPQLNFISNIRIRFVSLLVGRQIHAARTFHLEFGLLFEPFDVNFHVYGWRMNLRKQAKWIKYSYEIECRWVVINFCR